MAVYAQDRNVSGTVKDEGGNPMPGVNIIIKGTSSGTATDGDGKYTLSVSANGTLIFTFVGYTVKEVPVGTQTVLDVQMEVDATTLSEIVVTGYSSQDRRNIIGSVAVVDTKDMMKINSTNVVEALQGKVAGVQISSNGGPGAASMVRIRGIGSINNNEPLYVIDGIPVQNEANLNFLNPGDIESMQVLKDASSASIYGSRASNGVVIITTKKGKGKMKLNVDAWTGINSPTKFPEVANPAELLLINQGLAAGAGQTFSSNLYINQSGNWVLPDYMVRGGGSTFSGLAADFGSGKLIDPANYFLTSDPNGDASVNYLIQKTNKGGTDWFKELFQPAGYSNVQVSASGSTDKGQFYFSANYVNNEGIMIKNDFKRYQTRFNSTFSIKDNIRVGQTLNLAYQTLVGSFGNANEGSPLRNAYSMPQLVPVYDINGYWGSAAGVPSNASNPIAAQHRAADGSNAYSLRINAGLFAEVDFLKDFTAKTQFGLDYAVYPGNFYGFRNYDAAEINASNTFRSTFDNNRNWVFFNTITYNKTIGDHTINALVGMESKEQRYNGFFAAGSRLEFGDDPNYRTLNTVGAGTYQLGGSNALHRQQGFFGSVNYSLKDKYLVSASVRRDGSSRFINNRYGTFPAASVGWRLKNESFMSGISQINDLKIKASYGILGNNEVLGGDNPGFSNFGTSVGTSSYDIRGTGNSTLVGFDQVSTGNPDLKWESSSLLNIGFDATILKNLDISVEWYNKKTTDMIYPVELPLESGSNGRRNENIGDMQNTGIDIQLGYKGKVGNEVTYNIGLTGTTYKNEVLKLDANSNTFIRSAGSRIGDITITTAGQPISQFYGYIADGLWTSQTEINTTLFTSVGDAKVGRVKFRDLNDDGQINSADETYIGNPLPKFILGLNLSVQYKGFDVTAFVTGQYGQKVFNFVKYFIDFPAFQANYSKDMLYEAGKSLPVLDRNDNYSPQRSTLYVEDGSFTRLRNLMIGYSLPANITSKLGLSKFRVYGQGQNLFLFTKYSGLDPDVSVSNVTDGFAAQRDLAFGVDNGRFPWYRTFMFGINVEF